MFHGDHMYKRSLQHLGCLLGLGTFAPALAQTSTTLTETVNKRNTIGVVSTSSPSVAVGTAVPLQYVLHTAGAPAPTASSVQFLDGGTAFGPNQAVTSLSATNLLPYSQIVTTQGWNAIGIAPSVTSGAADGPGGSSSSATTVSFPSTSSSGMSGLSMAVAGTAYASTTLTLSVWAQSSAGATISLGLTDSPATAANGSNTCILTSAWQRCTFSLAFPANAGTGFAARLSVSGQSAVSANLWGAQVEQATTAGPYVSTIGTARSTGAQGGAVSFSTNGLAVGTHTISVSFPGDSNFVSSISNAVSVTITQAAASIALTASPASPATYGTSLTLTATASGPSTTPGGTVQLMDGATSLGTATLNGGGVATFVLNGASALAAGLHSLQVAYSGDSNYTGVNSNTLAYSVNKSSNTTLVATSSLNPSTYGDSVTVPIVITSSAGTIPTGTVSISDGGTPIGTVTLDVTGHAVFTMPQLGAGSHVLVFTYSGDANYN